MGQPIGVRAAGDHGETKIGVALDGPLQIRHQNYRMVNHLDHYVLLVCAPARPSSSILLLRCHGTAQGGLAFSSRGCYNLLF